MPSVLGQIGQSVADNLFEIGQSAVAGTVKAATDIAGQSIEQITSAPSSVTTPMAEKQPVKTDTQATLENRKMAEKQRFEAVKAELAQFVKRKAELDRKIAEEKAAQSQQAKQEDFIEKKKKDSWVNKIINRSQTTTENGRLTE